MESVIHHTPNKFETKLFLVSCSADKHVFRPKVKIWIYQ